MGAVTVTTGVPGAMVNIALLISVLQILAASNIFIKQFVEGILGIVQVKVPLAATAVVVMLVHVDPEFVEYCIVRLALVPVATHVILRVGPPTCQDSPPLGEVIRIEGSAVIVNAASLTSVAVKIVTSVTLIKQFVEAVLGTTAHT